MLKDIKSDYESGYLVTQLEKKYGFSFNSIKAKLKQVTIIKDNRRVFTESDEQKVRSLWLEGKSQNDIAKLYNTTQTSVQRFFIKIGLSGNRTSYQRFLNFVNKTDSCWEWNGTKNSKGYGYLLVDGKNKFTHRYSYEYYKGKIPIGMFVCHTCDNPSCVNPNHLFLGTNQDNINDKVKKNRQCKGEDTHNAKLTETDISKIRQLISEGLTNTEISKIFNVTTATISAVKTKRTWVHVGEI